VGNATHSSDHRGGGAIYLRAAFYRLRKKKKSMVTPFDKLKNSIQKAKLDFEKHEFSPQNEIDFNGYLFHIWLSSYPADRGSLHLEARVRGYKQPRGHADLAYGQSGKNPKGRPWVEQPKMIVESKSFRGFTSDQKALRRKRLEQDIKTLGEARLDGKVARAVIVLDDTEEKERHKRFISSIEKSAQEKKVRLIIIK
jgi:hypothetical protein